MRNADKRTVLGNPLTAWLAVFLWAVMGHANAFTPPETMTPSNEPPLHTVTFQFSADQLQAGERQSLGRLVETLDPGRVLLLTGYTDDIGPPVYNDRLALRRAEAVRKALVKSGYQRSLIHVAGHGSGAYLSSNETAAGRAQNRRVEIRYANAGEARVGRSSEIDPLRVGRYLSVAPVPSASQTNPLRTLIHVTFPRDIDTLGAALEHLLARSGWRLADRVNADPSMGTLLALPLPEAQRRLGPVPLIEAVKVLCGPSYDIVLDPVHRLLSCELKAAYATLLGQSEPINGKRGSKDAPEEDNE